MIQDYKNRLIAFLDSRSSLPFKLAVKALFGNDISYSNLDLFYKLYFTLLFYLNSKNATKDSNISIFLTDNVSKDDLSSLTLQHLNPKTGAQEPVDLSKVNIYLPFFSWMASLNKFYNSAQSGSVVNTIFDYTGLNENYVEELFQIRFIFNTMFDTIELNEAIYSDYDEYGNIQLTLKEVSFTVPTLQNPILIPNYLLYFTSSEIEDLPIKNSVFEFPSTNHLDLKQDDLTFELNPFIELNKNNTSLRNIREVHATWFENQLKDI